MRQSRVQLTSSAVNNRVATSYPAEKGVLVALSAKVQDTAIDSALIWARLSISADGQEPANIVATLNQGHIGSGVSLSWTGSIPLTDGMRLMLETWGRTATTVIMDAITV